MAAYPDDLHYTKDHEWIRVEGNVGTIGITDFAQDSLGDIVHVQLPEAGTVYKAHDTFGEVESVKTFSELYIPVSGEVTAINDELGEKPQLVNDSPYTGGWMVKITLSNPGEIDSLLSAKEYEDFIESQK